jgi:hypothetical protein
VHSNPPIVVYPRNPEHDLTLGLTQPLKHRRIPILAMFCEHWLQAAKHLVHRLVKLILAWITTHHLLIDILK